MTQTLLDLTYIDQIVEEIGKGEESVEARGEVCRPRVTSAKVLLGRGGAGGCSCDWGGSGRVRGGPPELKEASNLTSHFQFTDLARWVPLWIFFLDFFSLCALTGLWLLQVVF